MNGKIVGYFRSYIAFLNFEKKRKRKTEKERKKEKKREKKSAPEFELLTHLREISRRHDFHTPLNPTR